MGNRYHRSGIADNVEPRGDCLVWTRATDPAGYGILRRKGKLFRAHRVAWAEQNGPIPDGLILRHTCDNPPCVNVEHLLLGTRVDNGHDARERNRMPRGENHHSARLTEAQVVEARRLRSTQDISCAKIGAILGAHPATIRQAITGSTWKHLGGVPEPKDLRRLPRKSRSRW